MANIPPRPDSRPGIYLFLDSQLEIPTMSPMSRGGNGNGRPFKDPDGGLRTDFTAANADHCYDADITNLLSSTNDQGHFDDPTPHLPLSHPPHDMGPAAPRVHELSILLGIAVGVGLGFLFYYLKVGPEFQKLVMLPGALFVRALRCLVVPLVFCVLTIVVADTVSKGRSSILRWRTLVPYVLSSFLSTVQGVVLAILFQSSFTLSTSATGLAQTAAPTYEPFNLTLQCANGLYVAASNVNGSLACTDATAAPFLAINQTIAAVAQTAATNKVQTLTLVDQLVAIASLVVPDNIFAALSSSSLLSIVMFSIPLGAAVALSASDGQDNRVLHMLRQLRTVYITMLNGLLRITPVAIAFLLAGAACKVDAQTIPTVLSQVAVLFLALLLGAFLHTVVVLPLVLLVWTKSNPFAYLKHLIPAYIFAFGCASSMATLPVAIACIQRANVSRTLAYITMPFGTPVNMNAAGLYYPLALVFMPNMSGMGALLTPTKWIVVFFVSLLGSMSTAPVPSAALVYILTAWQTVFPATPLPTSFAWIAAADFLLNRIRTMVNVNGNAVVTRILAEDIDETFEVRAQQHVYNA